MKKILSIFLILSLLYITFFIINNPLIIIESVKYSFKIWINNVFPSLFPFFILSDLLINYGFVELLTELFKNIFSKMFKINGEAAFVFFMSLISGFPSSAKYTRQLYNEKLLNEYEATKIMMFSFFSNPLFITGTVYSFILDKNIIVLIISSHYLSNIIIGLIIRNYHAKNIISKFSIKRSIDMMHNKRINSDCFGKIITNSLINAINTLLLILGSITTCLILLTVLENIFNLSIITKTILGGILEITQSLKYINLLNINLYYKGLLITSILSFGGISIHLQIISIISDTKIKYMPFLLSRILHVIISDFLFILLYKLF